MKIVFLNGSLEPGRDGVGDYTRSLAQECVRQGHACCLIALNDRWMTEPERADENEMITLRLPAALDWLERSRLAKETLNAFQPDWISLQFVPYSFHPKGIVHGLAAKLKPLMERAKIHIMFHELWLGEAKGADTRERIIGFLQKQATLILVRRLRPRRIHASNSFYCDVLKRNRIAVGYLPLFGNLPVSSHNGDNWLFPLLQEVGLMVNKHTRGKFWLFGFFGTLYPGWSVENLLSLLSTAAKRANRKVVLLSIGRIGANEKLWDNLKHRAGKEFVCLKLGEQPAEMISQYLLSLDFGLSPSPYNLTGKSGVIAAMRDHGLPVIVLRNDVQPARGASPPQTDARIILLDASLPSKLCAGILCEAPQPRLPEVTMQFITDIETLYTNNGE